MQPSHIFSHCSEILLSFLLILAILMDPRTMRHQSSDLTDLHWWKKTHDKDVVEENSLLNFATVP